VIALDDELDIRNGTNLHKNRRRGYELEVLAEAGNLFRSNGGYAQIECHGRSTRGRDNQIIDLWLAIH